MNKRVFVLLIGLLLLAHMGVAQEGATYAAYQPFEGGMMIWRGDTGGIWVLVENGWQAHYYPQSAYESLPDNPVTDQPPANRIKPTSGFGRVWGNFAEVRSGLGWAIEAEQGYNATFQRAAPTAGGLSQTSVNLPGGRRLLLREDQTWGFPGHPRTISSLPPTSTFRATYQPFEGGIMLYWSETGNIWVLENTGRATLYTSTRYGRLSDNPVREAAPGGRVKPILGLGKVWGHFPAVRAALGWAIAPESGYLMRFERTTNLSSVGGSVVSFLVSMPDGRSILIRDNNTWNWR